MYVEFVVYKNGAVLLDLHGREYRRISDRIGILRVLNLEDFDRFHSVHST